MTPREHRLRTRIDHLMDERDKLRMQNDYLRRLVAALKHPDPYPSEEERMAARRRTWRESKRRAAQQAGP